MLGAGGTPGGAYIRAALAELESVTGWSPGAATTIIGTSVGALNAARQPLPNLSRPATSRHVAAFARLAVALMPPPADRLTPLVARMRYVGGRAVARLAPAGSHAQDYEVASPPYHQGVVTVSVKRGSGERRPVKLVDAAVPHAELYASAAVPGYTSPVLVGDEERIDGAVWSSTNADLVRTDDHDVLVVIAPMVASTGGNLLARSHRAQLVVELRPWIESDKPLVVVTPSGDQQRLRPDHSAFAAAGMQQVRDAWLTTTGLDEVSATSADSDPRS